MYQVLYRKYRPSTFEDVYGQEHITTVLKNEIASNRISHAFLFTGTRGTGKTTCAKILAKAVNCLNSKDGDPCLECENCVNIENGSIFDVVEIDAASNNGVDNIRELREESNYTPASAKYRVYIIDEVHMLSQGAFNALLKTLEEPPAHVIFILATTEVHKIPATILSRCQRFDFHRISPEDCSKRIKYVASKEGFSVTDEAALLIARLSDGAMRDALSLLDQCVGADNEITVDTVTKAAGLADKEYLFALSDAVINCDSAAALSIIDKLHNDACDMERLCDELISHFRNIMVIKTVKHPEKLIVATPDEIARFEETAKVMTLSAIITALDAFQNALSNIKRGTSGRIETEMAFLKLISPEVQGDINSILQRLSALENGTVTVQKNIISNPVNTQDKPVQRRIELTPIADDDLPPPPVYDEIPERQEDESEPDKISTTVVEDGLIGNWDEVVQLVLSKNRLIGSQLVGSNGYVKGDFVLIDAKFEQFRDLINNIPECKEAVKGAIATVLGRPYKIGPYKKQINETADKFEAFVSRFNNNSNN